MCFGAPLAVAVAREGAECLVPLIVRLCVDWIEANALDEEGLYRVPGSLVKVNEYARLYDDNTDEVAI